MSKTTLKLSQKLKFFDGFVHVYLYNPRLIPILFFSPFVLIYLPQTEKTTTDSMQNKK